MICFFAESRNLDSLYLCHNSNIYISISKICETSFLGFNLRECRNYYTEENFQNISQDVCKNDERCRNNYVAKILESPSILCGSFDCPEGDDEDEIICTKQSFCPLGCSCPKIFFLHCKLPFTEKKLFTESFEELLIEDYDAHQYLDYFTAKNSNPLQTIKFTIRNARFSDFSKLSIFKNIKYLNLQNNNIKQLKNSDLIHLKYLLHLDLSENMITNIEYKSFINQYNLIYLDLSNINIQKLYKFTFNSLIKLENMVLRNSKIKKFDRIFDGMYNLKNLSLKNTELNDNKDIPLNIFQYTNLTHLNSEKYFYCCFAARFTNLSECFPKKKTFDSCEQLLSFVGLKGNEYFYEQKIQ